MKIPLRKNSRGLLLALPAAVASISMFAPHSAEAASYTYNTFGSTLQNWSTASWLPSGPPTSNLDNVLVFSPSAGNRINSTNNLGAGFQLNTLSISNNSSATNAQTYSIAGNSLNFVSNSLGDTPSILLGRSVVNGGAITITAPFTVTNALSIVNFASSSTTSITLSGAITNTAGITISGTGAAAMTVSSVISGAGNLTMTGTSLVTLSGASTYTGVTTLGNGVVSVSTINNGGASSNLGGASAAATNLVFDGGTLRHTGASSTSDRAFTINTGKVATIEVANSLSLAGATGVATNGALRKTGAGSLTLTGVNTYTGATTVSEGTLLLSAGGSIASSSLVLGSASTTGTFDVSSKASYSQADVSGNGTIIIGTGKVFTVTGILSPGASAGKLNVTGDLALASTTSTVIEISGTSRGVSGGYDAIDATGSMIHGGELALTLTGATVYDVGTTFNLFDTTDTPNSFSGDFSSLAFSAVATPYAGLTFGSSIAGVWTSSTVVGGAADGQYFVFDEGTGDLSVVPEPSSVALLTLGGLTVVLYRKRRRS